MANDNTKTDPKAEKVETEALQKTASPLPSPRNPAIFDWTQPMVVTRRFMGGDRFYKANEVFDAREAGASEAQCLDLHNGSFIRNGLPAIRKADPAREAAKARREEMFKKRAEAAQAEKAYAESRSKAARIRGGRPFIG